MNHLTRFITSKTQLARTIKECSYNNVQPIINYTVKRINNKADVHEHMNVYKHLIRKFSFNFHTLSVSSVGLNYDTLSDIIEEIQKNNCICIVDAEKYLIHDTVNSYVDRIRICQPFIPNIYKTYQMYRKDAMEHLIDDIKMYKTLDIPLNINLIRGRYMDDKEFNVIYDTKEEVDDNYNKAVKMLLKMCLLNSNLNVIFTTHNKESIEIFKNSKSPNVHHAFMMDFEQHSHINDKDYSINRMVYLPFKPYNKKIEERVYQYSSAIDDNKLKPLDCNKVTCAFA